MAVRGTTSNAVPTAVREGRLPALARLSGAGRGESALEFVTFRSRALADLKPQAIGLTYWFDAAPSGDPYQVAVRFTGRRLDVRGKRAPTDDFQVVASLAEVLPGSGRVALTHRVVGKPAGRWQVNAEGLAGPTGGGRSGSVALPKAVATGSSTYAPVARMWAPGVVIGAWPVLVGIGVVAGLVVQGLFARAHGLSAGRVLVLALVGSVLGIVGAKAYYRLTHRREKRGLWAAGMSVQGFIITAVGTFVVGGAVAGVPIGHLLDVTVPALLLGQAVGRLGCLFAGCCSGVPTHSRWGLWSSDRHVGTRRVPVQLLESGLAGALALATGGFAWVTPQALAGATFVAGMSAYVVARQLLFPLRGLPRVTAHGRQVSLVVAALALMASVGALAVS